MTITLTSITRPTRATLTRAGLYGWAVLVSLATVVNFASGPAQLRPPGPDVPDTRLSVLETQLAELRQQAERWDQQPAAVTEARFDDARRALEQRLASVEQTLGERVSGEELDALREHIERIDAHLQQAAQPPPAPTPTRPSTPPAPPQPPPLPFAIVGLELRGGQRFIAITPTGASSGRVSTRVLHAGETESGWRLEAIEGRTAVLRHGAHVRRVDVP
ncbi:hypothetical protein LDO31_14685 [Luteimonas sp. XNQY3]|nr:hypothetical protein [Luteimonas sp. XNQY3]MCD9007463.1 hypothetical protein [Luteimonas sp. XNQY3]